MRLICFIVIVTLLSNCYGKRQEAILTGKEGELMPAIKLLGVDSITTFSTSEIAYGKPTILLLLEPACPYCKAQTKSIISKIKSFKDINIYMLFNGRHQRFKKFNSDFELEKYPNIKAGIDFEHRFAKHFEVNAVPYMAVYGENKRLKQVLAGRKPIRTIKRAVFD